MLDYIRCRELTKTGGRHEHILFRGSYIDQMYLSHLWENIHGAPVVWIQYVRGKGRLAGYLAKYASKGVEARIAYSWGWVWRGFARSWFLVKAVGWKYGLTFSQILTYWRECIILDSKPDNQMMECLL